MCICVFVRVFFVCALYLFVQTAFACKDPVLTQMYVCVYLCVYVCICVCVCLFMCTCVFVCVLSVAKRFLFYFQPNSDRFRTRSGAVHDERAE